MDGDMEKMRRMYVPIFTVILSLIAMIFGCSKVVIVEQIESEAEHQAKDTTTVLYEVRAKDTVRRDTIFRVPIEFSVDVKDWEYGE